MNTKETEKILKKAGEVAAAVGLCLVTSAALYSFTQVHEISDSSEGVTLYFKGPVWRNYEGIAVNGSTVTLVHKEPCAIGEIDGRSRHRWVRLYDVYSAQETRQSEGCRIDETDYIDFLSDVNQP